MDGVLSVAVHFLCIYKGETLLREDWQTSPRGLGDFSEMTGRLLREDWQTSRRGLSLSTEAIILRSVKVNGQRK